MRIKILIFSFFVFNISFLNAQIYETLESNAADLLISLSEHDPNYVNDIKALKSNLFIDVNAKELEKVYLTTPQVFDSLKSNFLEFENELRNISLDSALVLFNYWYLHFSNTFYNYAEGKFFNSQKQKILFFSTSMSCYCTLEMSRKQTVELLQFIKDKDNHFDYWIVDSYEHNELQIEHLTLFAPSVIVFDGNNEVLYKIEYEDKMLEQLTAFINNNHKSKS